MARVDAVCRRELMKAGLVLAGVPFCPEALFDWRAVADDEKSENTLIGAREIVTDEDLKKRILAKVSSLTAVN